MIYREFDYRQRVHQLEEELERVGKELWDIKRDAAQKKIDARRLKKQERRQRMRDALRHPINWTVRWMDNHPVITALTFSIVLGGMGFAFHDVIPKSVAMTYEGTNAFKVECDDVRDCNESASEQCKHDVSYYTLNRSVIHIDAESMTIAQPDGQITSLTTPAHDRHMLIYACGEAPVPRIK